MASEKMCTCWIIQLLPPELVSQRSYNRGGQQLLIKIVNMWRKPLALYKPLDVVWPDVQNPQQEKNLFTHWLAVHKHRKWTNYFKTKSAQVTQKKNHWAFCFFPKSFSSSLWFFPRAPYLLGRLGSDWDRASLILWNESPWSCSLGQIGRWSLWISMQMALWCRGLFLKVPGVL